MNDIKEMLYSLNNCLVDTFNVLLHTKFTRFRPHLPPKVNILRAQIHRNSNIIYHVNRCVNVSMVCPKMYITANIQLLVMLEHLKHFVAVHLSKATFK